MTTPTFCASCGHELGIGRYCTNCGMPVPGRHPGAAPQGAAPRPVTVAPTVPPPVGQLPPAARYPLYADPPPAGADPPGPVGRAPTVPPPRGPRSRSWLPWAVGVATLALAVAAGALLVTGSGDDERAADEPSHEQTADDPPASGGAQPDTDGTEAPVERPGPADVGRLPVARAQVPAVAPPSRDREGRPVGFAPANMLDGRPRTSWRMPGDGTGETITFTLGEEAVLTEVGLVNGYAKVDGPDDWYRGNRRVRTVQWEFDDGTRVTQELTDRRAVQPLAVDPVVTRTVRLHLVEVTPPGNGPNGRDFTAISEVRLLGAPR